MKMLEYIQSYPPVHPPRFLDVHTRNRNYTFSLRTAHFSEHHIGTGQKSSQHAHPVYHLIYFTEGSNHFQFENRIVLSKPGMLILSDPEQLHNFSPLDCGETYYHEITFSLEHPKGPLKVSFRRLLEYYVGHSLIDPSWPVLISPFHRGTLEESLQTLIEKLVCHNNENWLEIYRRMFDLFLFLIENLFMGNGETTDLVREPLVEVKSYIDHSYSSSLNLHRLASIAHYSEAHLCRIFKMAYGLSPMAYQQSLRIAAACNLLRSTNMRCKEIAHRLGYTDMYCFSKAFQKKMGLSPTSYRRQAVGFS